MAEIKQNNAAAQRVFYVCSSSADRERVGPIAEALREMDFPVYYDPKPEELTAGWRERVSEKIDGCYAALVFVTGNIFNDESYVLNEYEEAISLDKIIVPIFLDPLGITDVPPEYGIYVTEFGNLQGLPYQEEDAGATAKRISEQLRHSSEVMENFTREEDAGEREDKTRQTRPRVSLVRRRQRRRNIIRAAIALALVAALAYAFGFGLKLWKRVDEELHPVQREVSDSDGQEEVLPPGLRVGGMIRMGRYPQKPDGSERAIQWRVLDIKDGRALVISEYILDKSEAEQNDWRRDGYELRYLYNYHIRWKDSSLRRWLNRDFLNKAFTEEEIEMIELSAVNNPECDYKYHLDDDMNNNYTVLTEPTEDRIFLLNYIEAEKYFGTNRDRIARTTDYMASAGMNRKADAWWLREGIGVDAQGKIAVDGIKETVIYNTNGNYKPWHEAGIRPAMWVKIEESDEN